MGGAPEPFPFSLREWRLGEDRDAWREEGGGGVELYTVPIVEEDCPLAVLLLDCESAEVVVRKLAFDRRRSSLKIDILWISPFDSACFSSLGEVGIYISLRESNAKKYRKKQANCDADRRYRSGNS